jgi:hypothetical protein
MTPWWRARLSQERERMEIIAGIAAIVGAGILIAAVRKYL